nr:hypothetical transcript [Hymenolepis microstoma]
MSDCGNYSVQSHQNSRQSKGNSFHAKRSETPDSSVLSSGQGPSANARPPTLPNNHHQGSQSHYQNHRPYSQRGRGGHYGAQNSFGNHSNNRRYSPAPRIPNAEEIVSYMDSLWQDFKKEFKEGTGVDLQEEVPVQQSFSVSQPPMSPRVPVHVNSPHRGQLQQHRYSHQNSVGSNWSVNSGVGGGNGSRRFSENGEHSNTGSLRRHHNNNRGGGNYNASSSNQPWQRSGNFNNRQNSPNTTLNRQGQFLHHPPHYRGRGGFSTGHNGRCLSQVIGRGFTYGPRPTPRPVATATPPPVVSNVLVSSSSQQQESVVTEIVESVPLKQSPVENAAARPQKPSAPTASSNGNGGRKSALDVMSTTEQFFTPEPPSSPSSVSASVKATGSPTSINDR